MTEFIDYLVDISVTLFTYLSSSIQGDSIALYMAYGFCLISIIVFFAIIFSLIPKVFLWVYNLFKRSC